MTPQSSHLFPCNVKPHKKFAHNSHQFKPLNVINLKACGFSILSSMVCFKICSERSIFSESVLRNSLFLQKKKTNFEIKYHSGEALHSVFFNGWFKTINFYVFTNAYQTAMLKCVFTL